MPAYGLELRPGALRAARLRRGLTQAQVASVIGVPHDVVSGWELGRRRPLRRRVMQLAEALGVGPSSLVVELDESSLRARRELAGLSCKELAERIGVSEKSINRWQRNGVPASVPVEVRQRLEDALASGG